jgi:hypothetical protein
MWPVCAGSVRCPIIIIQIGCHQNWLASAVLGRQLLTNLPRDGCATTACLRHCLALRRTRRRGLAPHALQLRLPRRHLPVGMA